MRRASVQFRQGDPLVVVHVNSLVSSSAELQVGIGHEHSPEGLHLDVRFEVAAGAFERDGNNWRLAFGDRIALQSYSQANNVLLGVVIDEFAPVISPSGTSALVAFDDLGGVVPYQGLQRGYPGELEFVLTPPAGANMIFVTAIARRGVGG